ncbi:MAG TPA: hypothetical protein PKW21_13595, partial [Rhabdaerophilum sp.]|nr:hypothetical protein [Rhabdaerophilum sp.]
VEYDEPSALLADERTEAIYRIVEEALRNVENHSRAEEVSIRSRISFVDDRPFLEVAVIDDGIGFDPTVDREGNRPR